MSMAGESQQKKPISLVSSSGNYYMNQIQSFESNNPELFNLTSGVEMLGFSSKNNNNSIMPTTTDFYFNKSDFSTGFSERTSDNLLVTPDSAWQENRFPADDSSLRCVFPCEGNERPSQGLSLSLSSNKPSGIGLQKFELRETSHQYQEQDGFFGKSVNLHHDQIQQEGFLGKAVNLHETQFQLRNSKYLIPAQELLNEFCNLGIKQSNSLKHIPRKTNQWEDGNGESSSKKPSFHSFDLLDLQRRKSKLISMLEEVDRRYRQYCDQMKAVVSSFEVIAGKGSSTVYSSLASKAMSRHFKCLRDGIVGQIQAIKKAMGEKDIIAPGTTRGDTPRLRVLDQTLRQQKAFQQMNMMESHPWRPQRGLPERSVSVLRAWLFEHFLHPYPSDVDKHILAHQTGLSRSQVSNWFINARVRLWKPMVEEMYLEESKEQENTGLGDSGHSKQNPSQGCSEEQKPTLDQLVHGDSDSLSSIINKNPEKINTRNHEQQSFGVVDLDFLSYNHNEGVRQNFSNGVSLTLGLTQHDENGVSLAFSPASHHSLFFPRDHIGDCEPVQYSILDGETQNLPYRNLMGAQLLHDLAG